MEIENRARISLREWSSWTLTMFYVLQWIGALLLAVQFLHLRYTKGYGIDRSFWKIRNEVTCIALFIFNVIMLGIEVAIMYLSFLLKLRL